MKITLIQGSPHKQGASNILADQFRVGAKEAGHEVIPFDAAQAKISPCIACEYCHTNNRGICCQKDDMEHLRGMILSSEMVVFATPLYFFNMSAQMKTVVDRMYSFLDKMAVQVKKTALIVAANNPNPHIMDCIVMNYLSYERNLGWKNRDEVLGKGKTEAAYKLGASL